MKRKALVPMLALLGTILAPTASARAYEGAPSYMPPGHCAVWASAPRRAGGYVVGWGENVCGYPSSPATLEAGIEYKKCLIFGAGCYWTTPQNLYGTVISRPGLDREFIAAGIPWKGRHTYRIIVIGTCFNCRVSFGGQYGPEVNLR